jgi:hypothetical protein
MQEIPNTPPSLPAQTVTGSTKHALDPREDSQPKKQKRDDSQNTEADSTTPLETPQTAADGEMEVDENANASADQNESEDGDGDGVESRDADREPLYIAEEIKGFKWTKGGWHYKVKWVGYDKPEDNTWEPSEYIKKTLPTLVMEYWESKAKKKALKRGKGGSK